MTIRRITPLRQRRIRQRRIEDMTIRRLKASTLDFFISVLWLGAQHFRRSPAELDSDHVRQYQLRLVQRGCQPVSVNRRMTALRFFSKVTMGRHDALEMIPLAREPKRLREILTHEEVVHLIEAAPGRKYRCAISIAQGARLRSSAGGGKDRLAKLSPLMLKELRARRKEAKARVFLFPSWFKAFGHISARQYHRACREFAIRARIDRSVYPHMLPLVREALA